MSKTTIGRHIWKPPLVKNSKHRADLYQQWASKSDNHIEVAANGQDALNNIQTKLNETDNTIARIRAQVDIMTAAYQPGQPSPILPPPLLPLSGTLNTTTNVQSPTMVYASAPLLSPPTIQIHLPKLKLLEYPGDPFSNVLSFGTHLRRLFIPKTSLRFRNSPT